MGVYLLQLSIICIIALVLCAKEARKSKKIKKIFIILSFLILFCLMGFRDISVGVDTKLYCNIYKNTSLIESFNNLIEFKYATPFYALYNKIIYLLSSGDIRAIIISNSFIILFLICYSIYKESENVYASIIYYILFYFYLQGFNIARQFIAAAFILLGFVYFEEKKKKMGILSVIIAILIHNTAIVPGAFLLLLEIIKPNIKNLKKIISLEVIIGLLSASFISFFLKIFPQYNSYFQNEIFYSTSQGRKIIITLIYCAIVIVALSIMFHKEKELIKNDDFNKMFKLTMILIFAIIMGFLGMNSILFLRVEIYFSLFIILYLPLVIKYIKYNKLFIYLLSFVIMFIPFFIQLSGNTSGVIPFSFFK